MTSTGTAAGVRFTSDTELMALEDDFFDVETLVAWTSDLDAAEGEQLAAPMDLRLRITPNTVTLDDVREESAFRSWQVRQVAPIVAAWHGKLTLHASAVEVCDLVIAFVGESEAGKSTLAWELTKAGARPISDDLLPIRFDNDTPLAFGSTPVGLVCYPDRGEAPAALNHIESKDALALLARHGFGEHGDQRVWSQQFDHYHHLATSTRHAVLTVPEGRTELNEAAPTLIEQLSSTVS